MHPGSPSDPSGTTAAEAKLRCVYIQFQNHVVRVPEAKSDCSHRGKAKVRTFNFKTTWSKFQRPSQTAPAKEKPRCVYSILKLTWSESQNQVRIPGYQVRILLSRRITIPHLRVSSPPQSRSKAVVWVSTPRMYLRSKNKNCLIFSIAP